MSKQNINFDGIINDDVLELDSCLSLKYHNNYKYKYTVDNYTKKNKLKLSIFLQDYENINISTDIHKLRLQNCNTLDIQNNVNIDVLTLWNCRNFNILGKITILNLSYCNYTNDF